jgi:hypothetical protein
MSPKSVSVFFEPFKHITMLCLYIFDMRLVFVKVCGDDFSLYIVVVFDVEIKLLVHNIKPNSLLYHFVCLFHSSVQVVLKHALIS